MEELEGIPQSVLLAEDDQDDFDLFVEVIDNLSIKVSLQRAENGDVLIRMLHERIPDILFLDILMPCKDGRDCLLEIRKHKIFDHLPIIVYTSLRDPATIEFCYRQGTSLFVFKPDTYSELMQIIEKVFATNLKTVRYYPSFDNYVLNPSPKA